MALAAVNVYGVDHHGHYYKRGKGVPFPSAKILGVLIFREYIKPVFIKLKLKHICDYLRGTGMP